MWRSYKDYNDPNQPSMDGVFDRCARCDGDAELIVSFTKTLEGELFVQCRLCRELMGPFKDKVEAMCKWNIDQRKARGIIT